MKLSLSALAWVAVVGVLSACDETGKLKGDPSSESEGRFIPVPGLQPTPIITPNAIITPSRCGDGKLDQGEACEPALQGCCNDTCDGHREAGWVCRPRSSECDVAELCEGEDIECPDDAAVTEGTACGSAPSGDCDAQDTCSGTEGVSAICAANFLPTTSLCAASIGECDIEDHCSGDGPLCPSTYVDNGSACNSDLGQCSYGVCCPGITESRDAVTCGLPPGENIVFVSSAAGDSAGDFGGLRGADAHCTQLANDANLTGTYHAWLSSDVRVVENAGDRISAGPYLRVDGTVVADDHSDLLDGTLDSAISVTEGNESRPGATVWTGTFFNGQPTQGTCDDWNASDGGSYGGYGDSSGTGWDFTYSDSSHDCNEIHAVYCFQDDCPGIPNVNFQSDTENCGICGNRCGERELCLDGKCGALAFITSTAYNGDFNFDAGDADSYCNWHALIGEIPGRYAAWISTSTQSVAERGFLQAPYYLLDGTPVADGFSQLLQGGLRHPIDMTESRESPPLAQAWTATAPDGSYTGNSCGDWFSSGGVGTVGYSDTTTSEWTAGGTEDCGQEASFYCLQVDRYRFSEPD